ncbi:diacylglycerol kinase family enzyme [Sphingomonas aerolata]|uniref:Diacylglycerol kinase family enzyme n=1 Tax=Sphingomonas aerolata TaxID=185951 RepID=A0A2T4YQB7_9SPHN|nr:diacylglycerol kinase family protein [Sphingomonas aerolata]PTM45710.1 diacylglycerol kinase family enzyme [Sphingomonas aerolata]
MSDAVSNFQAFDGMPFPAARRGAGPDVTARSAASQIRTGIICNPKSHRNRSSVEATRPFVSGTVLAVTPRTQAELAAVLTDFAQHGIELLVIDGGDGTIRDVLTAAATVWTGAMPRVAIVPSGKTNALALDLGIPDHWTLDQALAAARDGASIVRRPVEVERAGTGQKLRGFLFGAGAFVEATGLAQRAHRAGAFKGFAVGVALSWAIVQTLFGRASGMWRAGNRMHVRYDAAADAGRVADTDTHRYILLASTLTRMPLGVQPFGAARDGLKTLLVDAPPRWLAAAAPLIVAGSPAKWLDRAGYHRIDTPALDVTMEAGFILDGEVYPGGALTIRQAAPISFVVP